jgi:hypothetical protein
LRAFFVFYTLNYRRLEICLTPEQLRLYFGLFIWRRPLSEVADCHPDDISRWRIGILIAMKNTQPTAR